MESAHSSLLQNTQTSSTKQLYGGQMPTFRSKTSTVTMVLEKCLCHDSPLTLTMNDVEEKGQVFGCISGLWCV